MKPNVEVTKDDVEQAWPDSQDVTSDGWWPSWILTGLLTFLFMALYGYGVMNFVQLGFLVLWITWAILFDIAQKLERE